MFREMTSRSLIARGWMIAVAACLPLIGAGAVLADEIHVYEGESIQDAINASSDGDKIIIHPGTYYQHVGVIGKAITVRSTNPSDPDVVASTVLDGVPEHQIVTCYGERDTVMCGFTIANGDGWGWDRPGGIQIGGSPTVSKCVFRNNHSDGGQGGGAGGGGAILIMGESNPLIIDCTFASNFASGSWEEDGGAGGAVCIVQGHATIINCVFTGNRAGSGELYGGGGGAIYCSYLPETQLTLINCTFWNNVAYNSSQQPGRGGAVCADGPVGMVNYILWDNHPDEVFGSVTVRYSDVMGGWNGIGNIDADPLFVDPDNRDFHLPSGSPCIDAGDNTGVPDGVGTDFDKRPRFSDDPETEDTGYGDPPIVDMGAYEYLLLYEDPDEDGILNIDDNCPYHYNPDQADCDGDGVGDVCALAYGMSEDCNDNGLPDECDIDDGLSEDCQPNGIPDECDLALGLSDDCNGNGVPDECDIDDGFSEDCNGNGIPDECDLDSGYSDDYDLNGVPDECDADCNGNGIPDACDLDCAPGSCSSHPLGCGDSTDCNLNGIPDECDLNSGLSKDCNENGVPDECDLDSGFSEDCNENGIPDECDIGPTVNEYS